MFTTGDQVRAVLRYFYRVNMEAVVLGTGPSLSAWRPDGRVVFGVNDVGRYHRVDYLICIDKPAVFTAERREVIIKTECREFITQNPEWLSLRDSVRLIRIKWRGQIKKLDAPEFIYSNNSPFSAAVLAYKMGFKDITLFGVDFGGHPVLSMPFKLKRAMMDFEALYQAFRRRGVRLRVCPGASRLREVIPG